MVTTQLASTGSPELFFGEEEAIPIEPGRRVERRKDMALQNSETGRTAIIFGGARGIGFASAANLAKRGDRVAIVDLDMEAAERAAQSLSSDFGVETTFAGADISHMSDVQTAFRDIEDKIGPADIVVNTAAILANKLFMESTREDWTKMIDVCLYGPLNIMHVMLPGMQARKYGRGVFLASDSARVGQARLSYYAAAKAGVIALVKSVAQEVGRDGITLNVVSPGATNTELRMARERDLQAEMGEEKYAAREKKIVRMYPVGRIGEPEDIAATVAFLASPEAAWTTGQVLSVNGGFLMP
tara:strand:+ start:25384 stop:26283 length:900 start_codon:yes stop_codon:yes gene_type:complete